MESLILPFSLERVFVEPWRDYFGSYFWILLMSFFVSAACGLTGVFLLLRRMALIGDAISHSVLPGIAVAFLFLGERHSLAIFLGALLAALLTSVTIEWIHVKTRIKQDAAISVAFTSFFALGVLLITFFAGSVDLDQECVLHGEIALIALESFVSVFGFLDMPRAVAEMAFVFLITLTLILLFGRELLLCSFDRTLCRSVGISPGLAHYALMGWVSCVVVGSFEAVGAILVVAMLIVPGANALLLSHKMKYIYALILMHASLASVLGLHLAIYLDASISASVVCVSGFLFLLTWFIAAGARHMRLRRLRTTLPVP